MSERMIEHYRAEAIKAEKRAQRLREKEKEAEMMQARIGTIGYWRVWAHRAEIEARNLRAQLVGAAQ